MSIVELFICYQRYSDPDLIPANNISKYLDSELGKMNTSGGHGKRAGWMYVPF